MLKLIFNTVLTSPVIASVAALSPHFTTLMQNLILDFSRRRKLESCRCRHKNCCRTTFIKVLSTYYLDASSSQRCQRSGRYAPCIYGLPRVDHNRHLSETVNNDLPVLYISQATPMKSCDVILLDVQLV